jgi:hypothetical protein
MPRAVKAKSKDKFRDDLSNRRQISISVVGRRTGRIVTLPVWFTSQEDTLWLLPVYGSRTQWFRDLLQHPEITIKIGSERRTFPIRPLKSAAAVRRVVRSFGEKYTPELIKRLYPGPLDVAVKIGIVDSGRRRASLETR